MNDEPYIYCDCPDPVDYSSELEQIINQLTMQIEQMSQLQESLIFITAGVFALFGVLLIVSFFVGWGAKR